MGWQCGAATWPAEVGVVTEMHIRLKRFWDNLKHEYWLVPTVSMAVAAGLAVLMIWIDRTYFEGERRRLGVLWSGDPQGARDVLSTVAGSIITVAGVVFSILIVALTLASSQFGPRLLRNFTRDRGNQITLGVFIGTFLYCLLVLRTVQEGPEGHFTPHLSITTAIVLAIASLGVLVYFIHHLAMSIQAENVVAAVGRDLERAIRRFFPAAEGADQAGRSAAAGEFDVAGAAAIYAQASGYLQAIDIEQLVRVAEGHDVVLRLRHRPGHFITEGATVAWVRPSQRCTPQLAKLVTGNFMLGKQRTATQDIEYSINQLVEVALRGLSPGINDPFVAIMCLDWLGAAFSQIVHKSFPPACRDDRQGRLRLILEMVDFAGVTGSAFDQIRQAARRDVAVTVRLLETLSTVAGQARTDEQREPLLKQARMIMAQCDHAFPEPRDRADARERYQAVLDAASQAPDSPRSEP
jgi:uncharacterized membrane protein